MKTFTIFSRWAIFTLLLATCLTSCQSREVSEPSSPSPTPSTTPLEPLTGPWSVTFSVTRDANTSYYSGASVKVDSDGKVENATWQNGVVAPTPYIETSQLAPEDLAALVKALADPDLRSSEMTGGRGPVELVLTINGKTTTLLSETDTLPGAAGRLAKALDKVAPLPKLELDKSVQSPQSR